MDLPASLFGGGADDDAGQIASRRDRRARRPRAQATGAGTPPRPIERLGIPHQDRHSKTLRNEAGHRTSAAVQSAARRIRWRKNRRRFPGKLRMARQHFPGDRLAAILFRMKKTIALVFVAACLAGNTGAQESPAPTATATPRSIRISFVPPPQDGTISLGVYDAKGKLVRVLFREADINEFNIGSDSLSTTWDGKDDAGENAPPGKYSAHGFVVGDLKIEGVGFFFNDWISSAEGPRFSRIRSLAMRDENLLLAVDLVPPGVGHVLYDIADKSLNLKDTDADTNGDAASSAAGRDGSRWVINGAEVKQLSANGEFLRRLPIGPNDPKPKAIAASLKEDKIYLLEENENRQHVRALSLTATKNENAGQGVSEWKVDFEKSIAGHKNFSIVDGKPVTTPAEENIPDRVKVKLQ